MLFRSVYYSSFCYVDRQLNIPAKDPLLFFDVDDVTSGAALHGDRIVRRNSEALPEPSTWFISHRAWGSQERVAGTPPVLGLGFATIFSGVFGRAGEGGGGEREQQALRELPQLGSPVLPHSNITSHQINNAVI